MHVYIYLYVYIYMYMCVFCICVCVCEWVCTCVYSNCCAAIWFRYPQTDIVCYSLCMEGDGDEGGGGAWCHALHLPHNFKRPCFDTHTHTHIHVHMHTHAHPHTYTRTHTTHTFTHTRTHTQHTRTHKHTYTHTHTHTQDSDTISLVRYGLIRIRDMSRSNESICITVTSEWVTSEYIRLMSHINE